VARAAGADHPAARVEDDFGQLLVGHVVGVHGGVAVPGGALRAVDVPIVRADGVNDQVAAAVDHRLGQHVADGVVGVPGDVAGAVDALRDAVVAARHVRPVVDQVAVLVIDLVRRYCGRRVTRAGGGHRARLLPDLPPGRLLPHLGHSAGAAMWLLR
jgi:hypothetical protein